MPEPRARFRPFVSKFFTSELLEARLPFLSGLALALALGWLVPGPVMGEEPVPEGGESELAGAVSGDSFPAQVEEITVTARRRSEVVQDIPAPISVISRDDLESFRIDDVGDLRQEVPNAIIERNAGTTSGAKIFLRGIGTDDFLFTFEPAIGLYVDDVYIPRQNGALYDFFDLERVEVLRGPQGTLYGRNSSGGALKLYTQQPGDGASRSLTLRVGEEGQLDLGGVMSGRLRDSLYGKISVLSKRRDGYSRDLVSGLDVNDQDTQGARASIRFLGVDYLDVVMGVDFTRDRSAPGHASSILFDPDADPYTLTSGLNGLNDLEQRGASLKFLGLPRGLGISLQSITAFRELDHVTFFDGDGLPSTNLHLFQDQDQQQWSQEVQVASTSGGPWQWVMGVFFLDEKNAQPTRQDIFGPGNTYRITQDTSTQALFGQLTYRFSNWLLTTGLRYGKESKDFAVAASSPAGMPLFALDAEDSWSHLDFRLEALVRINDRLRAYSSLASGYKSGGFNGRGVTPATFNPYDEEKVITFEAGLKSDLLDRRVRLNVNAFASDYEDLQLSVLGGDGFFRVLNAADVRIQGVELELEAVPRSRLEITANLGFLDSRYEELRDPALDPDRLQLKQAPELTARAGVLYTFLIGQRAYVSASASVAYTDRHFQNIANSPEIATDAHTLVDARLAYGPSRGRWEVALTGANLGDTRYVTGGFAVAPLGVASVYLNRPRWFAGSLQLRF